MTKRGYRTIPLSLKRGEVAVRASPRTADALEEIGARMSVYEGVRLIQVMEAVYEQGRKDGAREVFDQLDTGLTAVKKQIPHRTPGRPKLRR